MSAKESHDRRYIEHTKPLNQAKAIQVMLNCPRGVSILFLTIAFLILLASPVGPLQLIPRVYAGGITQDNTTTSTASSFSFTHVANALVIVVTFADLAEGSTSPTAVSIGGASMSLLTTATYNGWVATTLWYLFRSSSGTETIALTGQAGSYQSSVVVSETGTAQSAPFFEGTAVASCNAASCSVAVATGTSGRRVFGGNSVFAYPTYAVTISPASGFTEINELDTQFTGNYEANEIEYYDTAGATSAGGSVASANSYWAIIGTAILPPPTQRYEYHTSTPNAAVGAHDVVWRAQTFTVGATGHTITSVNMKLYRTPPNGQPGTVTFSIRDVDGNGHPTGADHTSGTINGNTLTTDGNGLWYNIALTEYVLAANTVYAIVFRAPTGSFPNNEVLAMMVASDVYGGGKYCFSSDSGVTWASVGQNYDYLFEIWGNPSSYTTTFSTTGPVGSDASGTILTVNSVAYTYSDVGGSNTKAVTEGSVTYAFMQTISSTISGKQYVWTSTSGTAGQTAMQGTFTPAASGTVIGNYKIQYLLTVNSAHGTPGGAGWYDSGSTPTATITPLTVSGDTGVQYVFTGWSGDASGLTSPSNPITMNGPKTAAANWKTQYWITVTSEYGSPTPSSWVDSGQDYLTGVTSPDGGYTCDGYRIDDGALQAGTSYTFTNVQAAHTIAYAWALIVQSAHTVSFTQTGSAAIPTVTYQIDGGTPVSYAVPVDVLVDDGHQISYTYESSVAGASGVQYVLTETSPVSPQTVIGDLTVTGTYKTQYYIIVTSLHGNPTSNGWVDAGNSYPTSVTSPDGGYVCDGYTIDGGALTVGTSYTFTNVQAPHMIEYVWYLPQTFVTITVTSSPTGHGFVEVDYSAYDTPYAFSWAVGDTHTLEALSPISGEGVRYVWASWNNSGTQLQSYIVPDHDETVMATYTTQYQHTITSSPSVGSGFIKVDDTAQTTPYTTPWWTSGESHTIEAIGTVSCGAGCQYVWQNWSDSGAQSHTVSPTSLTIFTANYQKQYYITVTSLYGGPTASGWINAGNSYPTSVTSPDGQYVCDGYKVDGGDLTVGTSYTFTNVQAAHTIEYVWHSTAPPPQYYITVTSPHGSPTSSGWVDEGQDYSTSVTSPDGAYICDGYKVDGGDLTVGTSYTFTNVQAAHTIEYVWHLPVIIVTITVTSSTTGPGFVEVDSVAYDTPHTFSWTAGDTHNLTALSPVSLVNGTQYVWNNWSDAGDQSHSYIVPDTSGLVIANYYTQDYLAIAAVPSEGGSVTPVSGWYSRGEAIVIRATENSWWHFTGWTGNYTGSNNPVSMNMTGPISEIAHFAQTLVTITITSNPTGHGFVEVDSVAYDTPHAFSWSTGTTHNLTALSPVSLVEGTQYVWNSWNDTGSQSHNYIVPDTNGMVIANYRTQDYLTMLAVPSERGSVTPASGWHLRDETVVIRATANSGWHFTDWNGTGSGKYTGNDNPANVTMNGPITETANFARSFVAMNMSYQVSGGIGYSAPMLHCMQNGTLQDHALTMNATAYQVDAGSTWSVTPNPLEGSTSVARWYSSDVLNGTATSGVYVFGYMVQYYLTVNSLHDTPGSEGWYDNGTITQATLTSGTVPGSTGVQYVFTGWSGDASGTGLTSNPIMMNGPKNATADWKTQYYVTMTVNPPSGGSATPLSGWKDADGVVLISASPAAGYAFSSWIGSGIGNYTGTSNPANITMSGPIMETANMTQRLYVITVNTSPLDLDDPQGSGTYHLGVNITISVSNVANYTFQKWRRDGVDYSTQLNFSYAVDNSHTFTAMFKRLPPNPCTITVNTSPSGLDNPQGADIYSRGAVVTISISNVKGYAFQYWTRNGTFYTYRLSFPYQVDTSRTFTAVFQQIPQYTITVNTTPSGLDSPKGGGTYLKGTIITIGVNSVNGYTFQYWTRNSTFYTYLPSFSYQVDAARTFTAVFQSNQPTQRTITVNTNPSGLDNPKGSGTYPTGKLITISVSSVSGYTFQQWNRDGQYYTSALSFTYSVDMPRTFTAVFQAVQSTQYTITVNTSPSGLDNPKGGGTYSKGTVIAFSVGSVSGYVFQQWNRDGAFYTYRLSFPYQVDAAHTFTAVFQQVPQYTITVNTNPSGLNNTQGNGTYLKGTVIMVSVSNVDGYKFQCWKRDGVIYTYRSSFPYQVDGSHTFTAVFLPST